MSTPSHADRMAYVNDRLKAAGKGRLQKVQRIGKEGGADLVSGALLIALSIRESGIRNVLGDFGHARGAFQINDRYHMPWLKTVIGCPAAALIPQFTRINWIPIPGTNAAMKSFAPTYEDGARYAAFLINQLVKQARDAGVATSSDQLAVAVAAYNCGFASAHKGYKEGDADKYTTGGDYSKDVLLRRNEVNKWLGRHPAWRA